MCFAQAVILGFLMASHYVTRLTRDLAVEQSLDAAIEIDEIIRGVRQESPAFRDLILNLIGSSGRELNTLKKDLLNDSRLSSLYRRAAASSGKASAEDFDRVLELFFSAGSTGLSSLSEADLSLIRDFCLGLNRELVSEAYGRTPEPPLARARQRGLTAAYEG
jgi:hypothetical protein